MIKVEIVIVLLILIVLVTVILIFGGSRQRAENRRMEKQRKETTEIVKKEIREKQKEIKKSNSEYTDILNLDNDEKLTDEEPVETDIGEAEHNLTNEDLGIKFFFDDEEETNEVAQEKNQGKDVHDQENIIEENEEDAFIEDPLDRYIKEAQSKNIGYLNGDDPNEEENEKIETEE